MSASLCQSHSSSCFHHFYFLCFISSLIINNFSLFHYRHLTYLFHKSFDPSQTPFFPALTPQLSLDHHRYTSRLNWFLFVQFLFYYFFLFVCIRACVQVRVKHRNDNDDNSTSSSSADESSTSRDRLVCASTTPAAAAAHSTCDVMLPQ